MYTINNRLKLEVYLWIKQQIIELKSDNKLDECFRLLFIKQCSIFHSMLPRLFENTSDYSELLLNVSFVDQDGVIYHLVHDIEELPVLTAQKLTKIKPVMPCRFKAHKSLFQMVVFHQLYNSRMKHIKSRHRIGEWDKEAIRSISIRTNWIKLWVRWVSQQNIRMKWRNKKTSGYVKNLTK